MLSNQTTEPRKRGRISIIPIEKKYEKNFVITRFGDLREIEISQELKNDIDNALMSGGGLKAVVVGDYTIVLSTISGIEPMPIIDKRLVMKDINVMIEEAKNEKH
jgi:hypothetical protein